MLFACLCLVASGVSVYVGVGTPGMRIYTLQEAFAQFLQHGFTFQKSDWPWFAIGFMLFAYFWIWKCVSSRHD